jgi:hypothetical protein
MDDPQIRHLEDARELWIRLASVTHLQGETRGAMGWKTVKGREYLTRYWTDPVTGQKHMNSLGARSPATETAKADFDRSRAEVDAASDRLYERLGPFMRVSKALRIGRLDLTAAAVLRHLGYEGLLGPDLMVAGGAAMHLYESGGGALLPGVLVPDGDLDLLTTAYDPEERLEEMLPLIRRADRSFRLHDGSGTAQNEDGFRIHLHTRSSMEQTVGSLDGISDLQVETLHSLLLLDPVSAVTIARDGSPVEMIGQDPRCFALMKYSRAVFDLDRDGASSRLDHGQAFAVGRLVQKFWKRPFEPDHLEAFPGFAEQVESGDPQAAAAVERVFRL